MIVPTIGRNVWFQPGRAKGTPASEQPFAAIVTYVHSDRLVNLAVFEPNGTGYGTTSVQFVQEGDRVPDEGRYAQWMPYQIGQAKKDEVGSSLKGTNLNRTL